jgi:hypothetical protein
VITTIAKASVPKIVARDLNLIMTADCIRYR